MESKLSKQELIVIHILDGLNKIFDLFFNFFFNWTIGKKYNMYNDLIERNKELRDMRIKALDNKEYDKIKTYNKMIDANNELLSKRFML